MKTINKSGGKTLILFSALLLLCSMVVIIVRKTNAVKIQTILSHSPAQDFVNKKYIEKIPIAELVNIGNFRDTSVMFDLVSPTQIRIYAAGELVYQLSDVQPDYFFKSDDIELIFDGNGVNNNSRQTFSWLDGNSKHGRIETVKNGAYFTGDVISDSITSKYLAEIRIPWTKFTYTSKRPKSIGFDALIGDNDDDYKQKAKIALFAKSDVFITPHANLGKIILVDHPLKINHVDSAIYSSRYTLSSDTNIISRWKDLPASSINNLAMGLVKDKYDLSAKIKTCWDDWGLNFYFEIQDANRKKVNPKKIDDLQSFLDYPVIENASGKTVWKMLISKSRPAGGAVKNRKIDQVVYLPAGKYRLRYITDESHAFDNWDAAPPKLPFYGVVIYKN